MRARSGGVVGALYYFKKGIISVRGPPYVLGTASERVSWRYTVNVYNAYRYHPFGGFDIRI